MKLRFRKFSFHVKKKQGFAWNLRRDFPLLGPACNVYLHPSSKFLPHHHAFASFVEIMLEISLLIYTIFSRLIKQCIRRRINGEYKHQILFRVHCDKFCSLPEYPAHWKHIHSGHRLVTLSSFTALIKSSFELKRFEERSDATLRSRQLVKYSKISANFQQLCECERHVCRMQYV